VDLMRRLSWFCCLLLSGCLATPPAEPPPKSGVSAEYAEYAGVLAGETTWSGEILVRGDVLVPAGSTLIVEPGTVVRVRPAEGTRIAPDYLSPRTEILVHGRLLVRGTADRPVRFQTEKEGDWAGLELDRAWRSEVNGARIIGAETGVLCIGCSPQITANRIVGGRYGIIVQAGGAPKVLDNEIADGEGGVFCWSGARPYLKGNRISGHEEEGIFAAFGSRPWLDRNRVTGNDIGIALGERDLPVDRREVTGNRIDLLYLRGGRP
jgi:hypothetical protein